MRVLILILAALGLTACATTQTGTGQPGPGWTAIEIAEGACFGTCPIYTIRVTPDDRYELNGERFTRTVGPTSGVLEAGSFQRLAAILEAQHASMLPADITRDHAAACGTSVMSDMPMFFLTIESGAERQVVAWYPGCAQSPYRGAMTAIREQVRVQYDYASLIAPKR